MLKTLINTIFSDEAKTLQTLSYIFCADEYLLNINRQFLHHDDYTDIVTFDLSAKTTAITGECYISIDRVTDNAKVYNTSIIHELLRVVFHGALHLCGYSDKTPDDIIIMRNREDHYLQLFFGA